VSARRRATLRLGWRLVQRSRARSALIAALVALPVLAGTFVAVAIRTSHLSPGEAANRGLGQADAIVAVVGKPLDGNVDIGRNDNGGTVSNIPFAGDRIPVGTAWAKHLPSGSRITPDAWVRNVNVASEARSSDVLGVVLDLADPITDGIFRVVSGRAPDATGTQTALTVGLAHRLHVRLGSSVVVDGRNVRVTATVENPNDLHAETVVAPAVTYGGLRSLPANTWYGNSGYWLVDTPSAAPDLHDQLLARGLVYETRTQWAHPAAGLTSPGRVDAQVLIVLGTVAGFGLLEILLLAGAAFAVGTRRQTHELGLLAATGGDDGDIRRTVLTQGALLGFSGAIAGVAGGVIAVSLLRGLLERAAGQRFGEFAVAASDLVELALLGVVAGLLAAVVPARAAAARPVLHMLRERYDSEGMTARVPRWCVAAIAGGAALITVASLGWRTTNGKLTNVFVTTGSLLDILRGLGSLLRRNQWPGLMWLGAAAMLAGLVRACPWVVSRVASLSARLPVSQRLALRDAARHRHRTAPAAAAVMTVVAGAVLVLFVLSSTDLRDKREFRAVLPIGLINVSAVDDPGAVTHQNLADTATRTEDLIGGGRHVIIDEAHRPGGAFLVVQDPSCTDSATDDLAACQYHQVGVASASAIDFIAGHTVPSARRALASGDAVLLDASLADGGSVDITVPGPAGHQTRLPAVVVPGVPSYGGLAQVYVSEATAARQGWRVAGDQALIKPAKLPSVDLMDRTRQALGANVSIGLQRPFHSRYSVALLAMFGAALIATLAGTSIAVALAMAESRADMATFAAVGASPVRRRLHAMGQAVTVASLGTGLGVGLGAVVAVATLGGSDLYPTSTPFRWLAAVLFGAPLLAIAVAGLFTRSRVPMTRRIA